jgi:hypothetical protein
LLSASLIVYNTNLSGQTYFFIVMITLATLYLTYNILRGHILCFDRLLPYSDKGLAYLLFFFRSKKYFISNPYTFFLFFLSSLSSIHRYSLPIDRRCTCINPILSIVLRCEYVTLLLRSRSSLVFAVRRHRD